MTIGPFRDEYRWLSNFWEAPIVINGTKYPTTEHFYQASKCADSNECRELMMLETPGEAKKAGRKIYARPDWEEVKVSVMRIATFSKFSQNTELARMLLKTGDEEIVELNHWHDNFWGRCECDSCFENDEIIGENNLGEILMEVRDYLQRHTKDALFF